VPDAVVYLSSVEQVVELMKLARAQGYRVRPAGAGTWTALVGREQPVIIASTARMDRVHEYAPGDPMACVEAGVRLSAIAALTAEHRQRLALDPPAAQEATVGAAFALGASGPLRHGFGTARDHILGLTLVTGDARVLTVGGRVLKNVAGYDLTRLVTGSRGALGLITKLNLKLRPLSEADVTVVVGQGELEAAVRCARGAAGRAEVVALELLSPALSGQVLGEAQWSVLMRLQGEQEAVDAASAALGRDGRLLEPGVWAALNDAELQAAVIARVSAQPSGLERTVQVSEGVAGLDEVRLVAHAGAGVVKLLLEQKDADSIDWPRAFAWARGWRVGLVVEPAGAFAAAALSPQRQTGVAALSRGLQRVFDPAQVLCDEVLAF
jgi:glycolate oxidase FAD binding subunit